MSRSQPYRMGNGSRSLVWINSGYKPPNLHKWGPGVRDVFALHYIVSGKGTLETQNGSFSLQAGDSFIIFPGSEIFYYPHSHDPWEYVWIEFKGEEAGDLLSMTELTAEQPFVTNAGFDFEPWYRIGDEGDVRYFQSLRAEAKLRLLLSYYMEYYPKEAEQEQTDHVRLAKQYIHHNYWNSAINVSDIVYNVKIDRSHLFRLFKAATGMSVLSYLTAYRIQRASELLKSSSLSIKSIAYSVGYKDQLYFSKAFKKATSYTPSEYMMLHSSSADRLTEQ